MFVFLKIVVKATLEAALVMEETYLFIYFLFFCYALCLRKCFSGASRGLAYVYATFMFNYAINSF